MKYTEMKKMFFSFLILFFTMNLCSAQRIVCESEVFNYENQNTILSIELNEYGTYFLSSKTESIAIGYNITEVNKTIERIQYFIEHDDLEYILIHTGDIFLKLFKEKENVLEFENNKFENYTLITTYITDGTDIYLTLYEKFVKRN